MLVEQIDGLHAQSAQRIVGDLFDVFGPTVESHDVAIGAELEPEFRRDHDLARERRQGFADQYFVVSVRFRGVEEGDAALDRCADDRNHLRGRSGRPEAAAHTHTAQANGRDLEVVAENPLVHVLFPSHETGRSTNSASRALCR